MVVRAVAKVAVGRSNGTEQVEYITREAALLLAEQERAEREASVLEQSEVERAELERAEPEHGLETREHERTALPRNDGERHPTSDELHREVVRDSGEDELRRSDRAAPRRAERDIDPLWTIGAPEFVLGEVAHQRDRRSSVTTSGKREDQTIERSAISDLPLDEKVQRAVAHFGGLVTYEESRGGVSHYRFVLTVGSELSNRELRDISTSFFQQVAPTAQVLVAAHRNTDNTHLHALMPSRGTDGKRLAFGQTFFHLDERWMEKCAEHLKDREIADEHLRLKVETLEYKRGAAEDVQAGREPRAKPDRWSDHWEVRYGRVRPFDDHYVGRVRAAAETAQLKDRFVRATKPESEEQQQARTDANDLRDKLARIEDRRENARSATKSGLPRPIYTVGERELTVHYRSELTRIKEERQDELRHKLGLELIERTDAYVEKLQEKRGANWAHDQRQIDDITRQVSQKWEQVLAEKHLTLDDAGHTPETLREHVATLMSIAAIETRQEEQKRRAADEEMRRRAGVSDRVVQERAGRYFAEVERSEGSLWALDPGRVAVHDRELRSIYIRGYGEHGIAADQLDERSLTRVVEERMIAEREFAKTRLAGRAGRAEVELLLADARLGVERQSDSRKQAERFEQLGRTMWTTGAPPPVDESRFRLLTVERERAGHHAEHLERMCREHKVERDEVKLTPPQRDELRELLQHITEHDQTVITQRLRPEERRGLLDRLFAEVSRALTPGNERDERDAQAREQEYGWWQTKDDTREQQQQTKTRSDADREGRSR